MSVELIDLGGRCSFAGDEVQRLLALESPGATLMIGGDAPARARALATHDRRGKALVLVELGTECLAFHAGEGPAAPVNVIGFARFRMGAMPPSALVELVQGAQTAPAALVAAQALFKAAGLETSVCGDVPGRIVDSLLRPYLNSALRSVDEGLATPTDLDHALRLGLGYPKGPLQLLDEGGLEAHCKVSSELHEALGDAGFLPARRARVQFMRKEAGLG